ncbi:MAG TPA: ABC transporter permease [Roseiarcus sp.]|nr:ABC transporter permease [Roseiarcus sp.]
MRRISVFGGRELTLLVACLLVAVAASAASPFFATVDNLSTVLRNSVELMIIGLGMTLLLAMGGIDVSIGMVLGLAALAVGTLVAAGERPFLPILAGPAVGALLGLLSGAVVVLGGIPAIVATLGLLGVYRAAIFLLLGGRWLSGLPPTLTNVLSLNLLGAPVATIVIAAIYLAAWLALRHTPYGPHLLAIGNGEEKARLSGIAVRRVRIATFVVSGLLAGVAAVFYVSTYRNVAMTIGGNIALEAIAAAVLGGSSITGGSCSLLGTALGVILIRLLQNGLVLVGVPSLWQTVVTGALLLLVLNGEELRRRLSVSRLFWRPS